MRISCSIGFAAAAWLVWSGCGGGGGGTGPSLSGLAGRLQKCNLIGSFRIAPSTANAYTCIEWPQDNETVVVADAPAGPVLRAGTLELPIEAAPSGECTFVAHGCRATPASSSQQARYLDASFTLTPTASGIHLDAKATDVVGTQAGACGPAVFDGQRLQGCQPEGTYTAASAAALISGTCQLSWASGDVTITKETDGSYTVDWGGTTVESLTLDASSCTLRGSKGISSGTSFDFWSWNGADRHLQLEITIGADGLTGKATDKLDGAATDGVTCPGGTFDLRASAPGQRPVVAFDNSCATPAPAACGDGICSQGESCACATDCSCQAGTQCTSDGVCRHPCTLKTESTDCTSGERCSQFPPDDQVIILPSDTLFCATAGPAGPGQSCSKQSDCQAGLICHVPVRGTQYTCAPPCGTGFPACASGSVCGEQGDGSGVGSYPTAVTACEHS